MSTVKQSFFKASIFCTFVCFIAACLPQPAPPTVQPTIPALVVESSTPPPTQQLPPSIPPTPQLQIKPSTTVATDFPVQNIKPLATPTQRPGTQVSVTPEPTHTPISIPLLPLPTGLVYRTNEGLWRVKVDGSIAFLFAQTSGEFSPDGTQFLYEQDNDIWLADFNNGTTRNITNTSDRNECCAKWWSGQPGKIVFGSWPLDYELFESPFGDRERGFLTISAIDGTQYEVLDDATNVYNWLAPSPRYPVIIYGQSVYSVTGGSQLLNNYPFVFIAPPETPITYWQAPAWSPDGKRLVFYVYRQIETQSNSLQGFLLINWEDQSTRYIHEYISLGTDAPNGTPAWSADGQYLAIEARDNNMADWGLWIFDMNSLEAVFTPTQNIQLLRLNGLVWHQITSNLICSTYEGPRTGLKHWLIDPMAGVLGQLDLPSDAIPVYWN